MKMFEERILRDGKCLPGGVLKVDGFINHQMDPALMMSLARELARRFGGEPLDRVLTVEASGDFLHAGDRVLFIDDFLANGNAALGMLELGG